MIRFTMPVAEYMSTPVVLVNATASAIEAEAALDINDITAVGVTDDEDTLVGVLSRTDLLRAADAEPGETFRVPETPVYELMSPEPIVVEAESPLDAAARRMIKERIHRVFVQRNDELVGVLSTRDVMKAVRDERLRTPAIEVATTATIRVKTDDPIALAVDRLDLSNRHGLIVTHDGWPVGTFAQVDALLGRARDPNTAVDEVMEVRILTLPASTPLYRLARQALAMEVRRVILMEDHGIAGILSSFDCCRAVAKAASRTAAAATTRRMGPSRARRG